MDYKINYEIDYKIGYEVYDEFSFASWLISIMMISIQK